MKPITKNIIRGISGFIAVMSIFLACGEGETITSQLTWTGVWLALAFISGTIMKSTFTKEELEEKA